MDLAKNAEHTLDSTVYDTKLKKLVRLDVLIEKRVDRRVVRTCGKKRYQIFEEGIFFGKTLGKRRKETVPTR